MLDMYWQLFEIEQTARDLELTSDQVHLLRQQEAAPILSKMKIRLEEHAVTALPSSSLEKRSLTG